MIGKKLIEVFKLSAKSQLDIDKTAKAAYLIEMLQTIAKGTKYESEVKIAIADYHGDPVEEGDNQ